MDEGTKVVRIVAQLSEASEQKNSTLVVTQQMSNEYQF